MNQTELEGLTRVQIQKLARRETIKANRKTVDIIQQLVDKYPDGVPRLEGPTPKKKTTNGSKKLKKESKDDPSRALPRRTTRSRPGNVNPDAAAADEHALDVERSAPQDIPQRVIPGVEESISSRPTNFAPGPRYTPEPTPPPSPIKRRDTQQIVESQTTQAGDNPPIVPAETAQDDGETQGAAAPMPPTAAAPGANIKGATYHELREINGRVTNYTETDYKFDQRLREIDMLIGRVQRRLGKVYKNIGEVQNTRSGMERYYFMEMKQDPRLLDGSHKWEPASDSEEESGDGEAGPHRDEAGQRAQRHEDSPATPHPLDEEEDPDRGLINTFAAQYEAIRMATRGKSDERGHGNTGAAGGSRKRRREDDAETDVPPQKLSRSRR